MNSRQIEMARHALGLTDGVKRSYRNRYTVNAGNPALLLWNDLVARGDAEGDTSGSYRTFGLTRKGAEAVLLEGESLDPEDFPEGVA